MEKTGANKSDQAKILRMAREGFTVDEICADTLIVKSCVESFYNSFVRMGLVSRTVTRQVVKEAPTTAGGLARMLADQASKDKKSIAGQLADTDGDGKFGGPDPDSIDVGSTGEGE